MIDLYALYCPPLFKEDAFSRLLTVCETAKMERILSYRNAWDAHRSLLGDLLARYLISQKLDISPRLIRFKTGREGKPFVETSQDIHFNIAHSGMWIVCALADVAVGTDIERIDPVDIDIALRFFSDAEISRLFALPEERQISFFYTLWTLKESYLKMTGKGLGDSLKDFSVIYNSEDEIQFLAHGVIDSSVHFKCFPIDPNYKTALCFRGGEQSSNLIILDTETFIGSCLTKKM
ncbi:4'-phosphopantetheinyl transferase superfamily protein [bacterium]|nr:4'-phosphopantetheinyl transferase superfamily protein [bacterium]